MGPFSEPGTVLITGECVGRRGELGMCRAEVRVRVGRGNGNMADTELDTIDVRCGQWRCQHWADQTTGHQLTPDPRLAFGLRFGL